MATITLAVTVVNVSGANYYFIDGARQATISATPGNTYKFDQADSSNSGHPLRLSITSNGTHAGGSAYTDGVTTAGTPGSSGAYTQIVVDATTVQTLYYYCTNHSNMGGSFNVGGTGTVQLQDKKGFDIQNLSSDSTSVGQMYYNTSTGSFKGVTAGVGSWASGGNLVAARQSGAGLGIQTASLFVAGETGSILDLVENYNGTSWSEVNEVNTARKANTALGTTAAGLTAGGTIGPPGRYQTLNEVWNGSGWSEEADLTTGRNSLSSAGTTAAGLAFAGVVSTGESATNESWNGSSWSEVAEINTARNNGTGGGTSTSAILAGGLTTVPLATTETWNGSTWTAVPDLNSARSQTGGTAQNNTDAIVFGGRTPPGADTVNTESWDGTSWTEVANLATARDQFQGSGASNSSALAFGGSTPPYTNATEEWTKPDFVVKTLTTS